MARLFFSTSFYLALIFNGFSLLKAATVADSDEKPIAATSLVSIHLEEISIQDVERKLIETHTCTLKEARTLLSYTAGTSPGLTQDEIAEALWVSRASVSRFLGGEGDESGIVFKHMLWYYENRPRCPLSILKGSWELLEVPEGKGIEEIFMDAKKYILLPKPLKNKTLINGYLRDLIGGNKENIEIISQTILIDKERLISFLESEDSDIFRSVYSCLRSYYCGDDKDIKPLSELIAERDRERSRGILGFFRSFSLAAPRKYERIKTE